VRQVVESMLEKQVRGRITDAAFLERQLWVSQMSTTRTDLQSGLFQWISRDTFQGRDEACSLIKSTVF